MLRAVLPGVHAVRVAERFLAGLDAVLQLTPCVPVTSAADERRPAANRQGGLTAKALAHRGQRKELAGALLKNADGRQCPEQAVQPTRVRLSRCGQTAALTRPSREQVRYPK